MALHKKCARGFWTEVYTKSELGANRGPRAGSPRGVVVATS